MPTKAAWCVSLSCNRRDSFICDRRRVDDRYPGKPETGVEIVRKALSTPARQIATNAGEDGSVIVGKILEKDHYAYGFDAQNGEYVNLGFFKGIIDPTKVVRAALQNAASIAGLLITTEAMVAERPKKDSGTPGYAWRRHGSMDY